jgi:hypothetical protein
MLELNQKRRLSKANTSISLIFGERKKNLKRIKVLLYNTVVFCPFKILF